MGFEVLGFENLRISGFGVSGFWGFWVLRSWGFGVSGFWGFGVLDVFTVAILCAPWLLRVASDFVKKASRRAFTCHRKIRNVKKS